MKSILGSLTLVLFLTLAYGAFGLYEVSRDKAIAPNEATASVTLIQHSGSNASDALRCDFSFSVGDNVYAGHGLCPTDSAVGSTKGLIQDLAGKPSSSTAIVYYDPNDPMKNSLIEFGARVAIDSMKAKVAFGLAAGCALLLGIGVVIAIKASQPGGGMVVDAQGTTIYPDQIKSNLDDERFSAHPSHISSEDTD